MFCKDDMNCIRKEHFLKTWIPDDVEKALEFYFFVYCIY